MPFPNFHSARVRNPNLFLRIRVLQTLNNGIMIYGGPLKSDPGGSSKPQTYRFPKNKFTVSEARTWLKEHNIKFISFEKAIQSFIELICYKIQALSSQEILSLIPSSVLNDIKQKDAHPFFQAYSICHEGLSNPKVLGESGNKVIYWTRKAVQSIKNIVTKGVNFFFRHNKDNSTDGRRSLGEIIVNTEKEINGKLHNIAIVYHPPNTVEEVKKYDICSQEAEWNFFEEAGHLVADSINKLTGIALSSSNIDTPGFPEARRLGMVQALSPDEPELTKGEPIMSETKTIESYHDLKKYVEKFNVFPSQLFNFEDIKSDKKFNNFFNEIETLKTDLKTKDNKINELENAKKELSRKTQLITAKKRLSTLLDTNNLTDNQRKFIEHTFNEDMEDLSDESLTTFINTQISEYKKYAAFFEVDKNNIDINNKNDSNNNIDAGDYTKAENNDLLDEDI